MFEPIRTRLLLSYLGVLAGILTIFSLAVRTVFIRSLTETQIEEMFLLAKAAATVADFRGGQLRITDAFTASKLTARNEALEWFNSQGHSIGHSGQNIIRSPLNPNASVQVEQVQGDFPHKVLAVTVPVTTEGSEMITGFVRASQSLEPVETAVEQLDLGLGLGSLIALMFSGMGGFWLMQQSIRPIEASYEQLKQFTADASHELRSPLMVITSNAKVALKYPEGMRASDGDKLEAIVSASMQMAQLTEDLLFLARTEKAPRRHRQRIDLVAMLDHLRHLYQSEADAKEIQLAYKSGNGPIAVTGDEAQLKRLFTNLIVNALRYTPDQGKVTIHSRTTLTQAVVTVEDTGIGIAPHQLSKVFDRFWQAESSRSATSGGSGLGLAIAQAIVNRHGGNISVTSQIKQGSCFTVKLPLA
ncbi:sensor histidine kinase [Lyngbya confervoides]|uniref:histidine kinase n=1 Tax=Lyngbya confervoides BDU141951 TaxID=1574623 RepID=A0ABD4T7T1_9CYAN|nr:HAMP domain-containing sensor histidine kinase [Lyngbya confervoides]MCM1984834.1 HAMP domain-containing histidine kinase [Lyngbya confervoides BDU141951]